MIIRNSILLLSICLLTVACSQSNATKEEAKTVTSTKTATPKTSTASTNPEDAKSAMEEYRKQRRAMAINNSGRAAAEINNIFPYDIDLKDADGKIIKSSDLFKKDKPTLVLFWLTTCPPCKLEMREIKKKYAQWENEADFNLVAISTDFSKNYDNFSKMVKENDWPWPAYNDVNREFRSVLPGGLNGLPQSFIFDTKGEIVMHKRKYRRGDEDKLFEKIKSL